MAKAAPEIFIVPFFYYSLKTRPRNFHRNVGLEALRSSSITTTTTATATLGFFGLLVFHYSLLHTAMVNSLRPYQARVVNSIGSANAIVKMPTGSGKTLVAAELMKRHLQQHPGLACLFLVPTQDLVDQQADVVA